MAIEIERKFLVRNVPAHLADYRHFRIVQGYVAAEAGGNEVRLRQKQEQYFLAVKSGATTVRAEYEVEMSREQFETLWPSVGSRFLKKTRYEIPYRAHLLELDEYEGPLRGLYTVEVEFLSEEARDAFEPPSWFGDDISVDKRYRNRNLAMAGLPKVKEES